MSTIKTDTALLVRIGYNLLMSRKMIDLALDLGKKLYAGTMPLWYYVDWLPNISLQTRIFADELIICNVQIHATIGHTDLIVLCSDNLVLNDKHQKPI